MSVLGLLQVVNMAASGSECMALDFDFSTCRCHLFVSNALLHCPVTSDNAPANLRHNPSSIHISFCELNQYSV